MICGCWCQRFIRRKCNRRKLEVCSSRCVYQSFSKGFHIDKTRIEFGELCEKNHPAKERKEEERFEFRLLVSYVRVRNLERIGSNNIFSRERERENAVDLPATAGPARSERDVGEQNIVLDRGHSEPWHAAPAFPSPASPPTPRARPRGAASTIPTIRQFVARLPFRATHGHLLPRPAFRQHRDGGRSGARCYRTRGLEALPPTKGENSEWSYNSF